ncbi:A-kinase anchor protein 14 [Glycine max]|nr:A-kinase anchor protein 14 [Glycine max]|eukprot:XP_006595480.1 A-kinase anchor protein 14 [Glycine max]
MVLIMSVAMVQCGVMSIDIDKVMRQYPEYSRFSKYLSQTQLARAICGRPSVTVLAVDNTAMGPLEGKPVDHIKNILRVHVALQYLDLDLQDKQTIALPTLSQGVLLKINKGAVTFVSATHPNAVVRARLIKPIIVSQSHNNISVVQVNSLIIPPTNPNALIPLIPPVPLLTPVPVISPLPIITPVPVVPPALPINSPAPVVSPVLPVNPPAPVMAPTVPVLTPVPVISPLPIITPVPVVPPSLPINPPAPVVSPVLPMNPPAPVPVVPVPVDGGVSTTPGADEPKSGLVLFGVNWSLAIFLTFSSIYLTILYH